MCIALQFTLLIESKEMLSDSVSIQMALSNVSQHNFSNLVDMYDTTVVNPEQSTHLEIVTFMVILIPVVNIPIFISVNNDKSGSFLNTLILIDCANALAHVPILLQQFW